MDMKMFEMKMRGVPIEAIARSFEIDPTQVEHKLKQLFPNFVEETKAWLAVLEEVCLFRGMNQVIDASEMDQEGEEKLTVSDSPKKDSRQVDYLRLAFDIRCFRFEKHVAELGELPEDK